MNRYSPFQAYLRQLLKTLLLFLAIFAIIALGILFGIDEKIIGLVVVVFGFISQAFASLLTLIAFIPFIGPLIVKVVALPFFWIVNGLGYMLSVVAIKRGYAKEVLNYRLLTLTFLIGIVMGYVIGKIL